MNIIKCKYVIVINNINNINNIKYKGDYYEFN